MKGGANPHGFARRRPVRARERADHPRRTHIRKDHAMSAASPIPTPRRDRDRGSQRDPDRARRRDRDRAWREWMMVAVGLLTLVTIIATIVSTFAIARSAGDT